MKLVFFGSSHYVIPIIEKLNNDFGISLVVTTDQNPADSVPSFCIKNNLECLSVSNFKELTSKLYNLQSITYNLGIVAGFGIIIPKNILDLFAMGVLNIHPSLLPKYRGPTPVQTAILNGDKKTGVSIIKLDDKIDHGPILTQREEEILSDDTTLSLQKRLFEKGANLLSSIIYIIESKKKIKEIPQDEKKATYTKPLKKNDGFIDIKNIPEQKVLKQMIKAYYSWPGVWCRIKLRANEEKKIIKLLPGDKIQVEGKKPMSYKDFINGYPEASTLLKNF